MNGMTRLLRGVRRWLLPTLVLCATGARAHPPADTAGGVDEEAVVLRGAAAYAERVAEAQAAGELGCRRHCAEINRVIPRILAAARADGEVGAHTGWHVVVVSTDKAEAFAFPGGQIFLSEGLIEQMRLSEPEIAFVLAHEVSHVLLQHERQTLAYANMLVQPRGVSRTVDDLYFQMGFDASLLLRLRPLLQAEELDADAEGLMVGARAGYAPDEMQGFVRKLSQGKNRAQGLLATHPDAVARWKSLQAHLPAARETWRYTLSHARR